MTRINTELGKESGKDSIGESGTEHGVRNRARRYYDVLLGSVIFGDFSESELDELLGKIEPELAHYGKGEVIFSQGEVSNRSGVILSGSIIAEGVSYSGTRRTISTLAAGELFGDILMVSRGLRAPVSIIAREDTTVMLLRLEMLYTREYEPLCRRAMLNLLGGIADKFWMLNRKIAYLSTRSLRTRIAMFLLDMQRQYSSDIFTVAYSRDELAALLAVNRCALSRELSRMQSEGMISFYKSTFKIIDHGALAELL